LGKPEEKRENLEGPGIDGRKVLRWTFRKRYVMAWTGSSWHAERSIEPSGALNCKEFRD